MIEYAIKAAQSAAIFDRIIVSTDDAEIATVSRELGAEVPFERPSELADQFTTTIPVVRHAIEALNLESGIVCCVYPTVPFLTSETLASGLNKIESDEELEFVISVTEYDFSIHRALKIDETSMLSMYWPENELTRSQDLPLAVHDAAQFYFGRVGSWMERDVIFSSCCAGMKVSRLCSIDIDTPEDWSFAESVFGSAIAT